MFFEYIRSLIRLAWDWVRSVAIEPLEGCVSRQSAVRMEEIVD